MAGTGPFLDRSGGNGLAGVIAVPVMTGVWPVTCSRRGGLAPGARRTRRHGPVPRPVRPEPEFADPGAAVARWTATAIPQIVHSAPQIGGAVAGAGEEVEHGPVVPDLA